MVQILDPTAALGATDGVLNDLPPSLRGLHIGVVDNAKPQADFVLGWLADRIAARYGVEEVVWVRKRSEATPAASEDLDRLANQVHLAVGGLAE